jgi:hypothetical protein
MSHNGLEHQQQQHVERHSSSDSAARTQMHEIASSAYTAGAASQLQRDSAISNDAHVPKATISGNAIEFGASNDSSHRTDAQGNKIYQHKDANGRVTEESITHKDGSGTARQYGADGSRTDTNWDKDGNQNSTKVDKNGRELSSEVRGANGDVSRYTYGADGSTTYQHKDANGRLTEESLRRADGSGEARQYGADGSRSATSWDASGNRNVVNYDKNDNVKK